MKIELDRKALFALASDRRLELLGELRPMRRTVKQLAEVLAIDKAAVHRHLQKLVDGGLVQRHDDHGFVYYGLTWKGRDILNPNDNTRIVILLTSALMVMGLAAALFVAALSTPIFQGLATVPGDSARGDELAGAEGSDFDGVLPPLTNPAVIWAITAGALLVLTVPLTWTAWRLHRRPLQAGAVA